MKGYEEMEKFFNDAIIGNNKVKVGLTKKEK